MFNHKLLKRIACIVLVSYVFMFVPTHFAAAQDQAEFQARQQIYQEKIDSLEAEKNDAIGVRRNLLTAAVAAFSAGGAITFAVNNVNKAIEDIQVENPEVWQPTGCIEDRWDDCCQYVTYVEEKRDALDAMDGIKGIGGGIFIVGAVSLAGYYLYTRSIKDKQEKIEILRDKTGGNFEMKGGLTPEYLQQNETVKVMLGEVDTLKQKAQASKTRSEIFSRLAIGSLISGAFLFGVANVSRDIISDITVDPDDPEDLAAKNKALDRTDTIETAGYALLGAGAASGIVSYIFSRSAKSKENEADELENGLLGIAGRMDIQPRPNGFMIVYRHAF